MHISISDVTEFYLFEIKSMHFLNLQTQSVASSEIVTMMFMDTAFLKLY